MDATVGRAADQLIVEPELANGISSLLRNKEFTYALFATWPMISTVTLPA